MDPGVVFVAPSEETADEEGIEIPLDEDGTCNIKVVQSQFTNAVGLRFRAPDTGRMRALRMDENGKLYPPPQGWDTLTCIVTVDKKRTREEEGGKVESEHKKLSSGVSSSDKLGDLIILGLSYKATESDVKEYFESYGEIKSCEIKKDYGGNSRGFGFISFVSDESGKRVMNETYHNISGRKCEVRIPKRTEPERKLFVGRLPRGTNEDDLTEYFSTFGALADVYIPRPHRGFAFVTFEKGDDADVVLKQKHFLKDAPLNVTIPDPPAKKQKFAEQEQFSGERKQFGQFSRESSSYYPPPGPGNPYSQQPAYGGGFGAQQGYSAHTPGYQYSSSAQSMQVEDGSARQGLDESEIEFLDAIVKKVKGNRKAIGQWN